ncbi:cupin domain-containing protein [Candidatus Halobonum tyrrellensis]|uniref:Cupin n=1 Tax=Candidatus Halobonum tyrrellensis G22 TaxID=1324957 RepID=V4GWP8_9EURY|nr:cupin domain-containing protein [Candidatus Halobonum tyrrellensis]ESP89601.1 cupin [Candidatus Halobonum tyrrellensis G22]
MGYRVVDPADVDPAPDRPCELRRVGEAAGLERMAVNRFRARPGEEIPLAYHYHDEQEELFYVVAGTLAVETPDRTYEVSEGSLFAVDPGSPQRAHNPAEADDPVTVLAVGAPPVADDANPYDPDAESDAEG